MAITLTVSDGTTTFNLVYDSSTQPYYHSRKGLLIISEDTDVLQHMPDNSEPVPIRATERDRTMVVDVDFFGADQDEVLDKIAALKRFIDGKDQQALRYHTHGDVNKVYLTTQLENATNPTYHTIKWGHVDDSGAHYTAAAQNKGAAIGARITLHLEAYGYGDAITLRNDLASSPHFIEDSDGDGVADGWAATGMGSTSVSSNRWVAGGTSQFCQTAASGNSNLQSSLVTIATATAVVGFAYVAQVTVGGDDLYLRIIDGAGTTTDELLLDTANATSSIIGGSGHTFYRFDVGGTLASANCRLSIIRKSADANMATSFYIDMAYLQTGTMTAPNAWCSTCYIENRNDPDSSNTDQINYLDIWGVPGDVEAAMNATIAPTISSGTKDTIIIGKYTDGASSVAALNHYIEGETGLWSYVGGSDSTPADATASGGSYSRFTADATPNVGYHTIFAAVGDAAYLNFYLIPHRIFLIARSSNVNTTFAWSQTTSPLVVGGGSTIGLNAANTWELIDIGYQLPISKTTYENFPSTGSAVDPIEILVTPGTGSATTDIDAVLLIPANEDGLLIIKRSTAGSSLADFVTVGADHDVVSSGIAYGFNGSIWGVPPGNKMTRLTFAMANSSSQVYHLDDNWDLSFTIYPRTRHLLGTL